MILSKIVIDIIIFEKGYIVLLFFLKLFLNDVLCIFSFKFF